MEKPLNVLVAEALGCHLIPRVHSAQSLIENPLPGSWDCGCPAVEDRLYGPHGGGPGWGIYSYPQSWAATGPLIEKYRIELTRNSRTGSWSAVQDETSPDCDEWATGSDGPTPLIAVCNLILALKDAGKLQLP